MLIMQLDPKAVEELRTHQTQLDMDGVMVGVSREALEHILAYLQHAGEAEPVAWMKPPHAAAIEPYFVRAEERTHDWQKSVFTIPLYASPTGNSEHGGVSEEAVWVAARAMRSITFNALTMEECRDAARAALTAASVQQGKGDGR